MKWLLAFLLLPNFSWAKTCYYEMVKDSPQMTWTAFKTTDKAAVNGTFDSLQVIKLTKIKEKSSSVKDWLSRHSFTIDAKKVNSKNPVRDKTLREKFFSMVQSSLSYLPGDVYITGKVKSVGKKDFVGLLKLNNTEKEVPMSYSYKKGWLEIKGSIDMMDFGMSKAHASIHKACYELHKGKDGVSKTWTQVDIKGRVQLKKVCK